MDNKDTQALAAAALLLVAAMIEWSAAVPTLLAEITHLIAVLVQAAL
jgi:hypothetical protein